MYIKEHKSTRFDKINILQDIQNLYYTIGLIILAFFLFSQVK